VTDRIHDFTAKLRQPAVTGAVEAYLRWQRASDRAQLAGSPAPPPPIAGPLSINLDLTTACNYRCDHCIDWDTLNSPHRFRENALRTSITTLVARGLRSVILIGGGEPTLYPGFTPFVGFLKDFGLDIAVVTNGSRGDRLLEIADRLGGRDWIRLSLDAGRTSTFREIHKPARKDLGLAEILAWIPRIKARNAQFRIGYSFVIVWQGAERDGVPLVENIEEIELAAERARRAGFDYISYKPILERAENGAEVMSPDSATGHAPSVIERIRRGIERARQYEGDGFDVHVSTNLRVLEQGNWRDFTVQPKRCHMQAFRQVLSPDGLWNCPAHRGVTKARLGDRDAYASEAASTATGQRLARSIGEFDASRECREVTCLYNSVNWWLEKRLNEPGDASEGECDAKPLDFFL
jgi:molybdenum cofactor biosynthesis enzyme MoaA